MDDTDFDIWNLIGLLRRQARLILITVLAVVGATAAVVFTLTPIYEASALVLVDTSDKNLLDPNRGASSSSSDTSRLESELEIMQSDAIMLKVIERAGLLADEEFGVKLGTMDRIAAFLQLSQPTLPSGDAALRHVLKGLKGATSADRVGLSSVISMSVRSKVPERAAEIANAWSAAYIDEQVGAKIDGTLNARNVLQSRLAQARVALVDAEDSLDKYIDTNITAIVGETGRADIADVRTSLQELVAQRSTTTSRAELAEASLAQRNWEQLTRSLQSVAVDELNRQREQLVATLETAAEGPLVNLRAELGDLESRLTQVATKEVAGLRQSVADSTSREASLRQRLRTAVLSSSLPADMLSQIYELQQGAELGRQQYQALLARVQELDTQASLQIADSRVVSPGMAPGSPSFPNTLFAMAAAIAAALGLGVALAFLREHLLGGLLTEGQAEAVLKVPVAAAIPKSQASGKSRNENLAALMTEAPLTAFPESIRRVKVAIDQAVGRLTPQAANRPKDRGIIVMVTSSTAGEGKSTVSLSLARAFATAHRKVALIDCDFRKPSVLRMSGLPPSNGLERLLRGEIDQLQDAGTVEQMPGGGALLTIATSQPSTVPTDHVITSAPFAALVDHVRASCEVVVLDTPPIGPVTDGLYLAGLADVIVFVVRSGTTSQTEAKAALGGLRSVTSPNTKIVAVLNQQAAASAQYKSQYGYYAYRASE